MSVSYETIVSAFLYKVTDYGFSEMLGSLLDNMVISYMKSACSKFNNFCAYNLMMFDDENQCIAEDIPEDKVVEIVDIIAIGMVVQWLQPYVYKQENLCNLLNTRDFTTYSPAELLKRVGDVYKQAGNDYKQAMYDYSYTAGDLTSLHI